MKRDLRRSGGLGFTVAMALAMSLFLSASAHAQSYWFETYEHIIDLVNAQKMDEASPLLDALIREQPVPRAGVRVPGDRFITYLPYLQRARIQTFQGDTEGALRSLEISEAFGVVLQTQRTRGDLETLRKQLPVPEETRAAR